MKIVVVPLFSAIYYQKNQIYLFLLLLLDKSRLTNKFEISNLGIALFSFTSKKIQILSYIFDIYIKKSIYNKIIAKYTHYKKSYHKAINCWIFHLELAKQVRYPPWKINLYKL